ncbi:MAG TPA: HAMP domain-containing sensor histidine kinase [Aliidongia sp.]|nr:HAMP domain-containing sensor histidine kinase [Aliidongia sp.]
MLSKATLLGLIFLIVPIILYDQFRAADQQKRELVTSSVRDQGRIIGISLTPMLTAPGGPNLPAITHELARYNNDFTSIKLLLHPATGAVHGFYYVASSAPLSNDALDTEREGLAKQGVLDRLEESCGGDVPIEMRYRAPDGHDEVVTSLVPVQSTVGCWAVVTSLAAASVPGIALGVPYYDTPEVRIAALIYLAMAALTFTTFWSIWRGLLQFGERARAIRSHPAPIPTFLARNEVPELAGVADEFDRMVETLQNAARDMRRAAEDNAHAFKTPVAIIRQSLEPVARAVATDNMRALRALGLIERSLDKLDGLLASARRLDEATADLLDMPRSDLDLSALIDHLLSTHAELFRQRHVRLRGSIEAGVMVRANADMVETVIENVLENAVSFSRDGDSIGVKLEARQDWAVLLIVDEGPGVPPNDLVRIFDRYFSSRTSAPDEDQAVHYGVGLWIVRRNIEALGGRVMAENREPHGLMIRIELPLKRASGRDGQTEPSRRPSHSQAPGPAATFP